VQAPSESASAVKMQKMVEVRVIQGLRDRSAEWLDEKSTASETAGMGPPFSK